MTKWTKEEEEFLSAHIFEDSKETALLFIEKFGAGRSQDSLQKKINRLRDIARSTSPAYDNSLSPLSLLDPAIAKQQVSSWLRAVAFETKISKFPVVAAPKSSDQSLVLVISDVHWGKKTKTFNAEIATERILSIPSLLTNADMFFDEIVVLLLGDLVEGEDVFAHQQSVIEAPVISAHKTATETIWKLLLTLRNTFDVPVRVECGLGNHGRMSKTSHPSSNWDCAIFQSLGMINKYSKEQNIIINVNLEEFNIVNVKGVRLLTVHEGPKHLGTPAMFSKLGGWIISKKIDALVSGHWHNYGIDTYLGYTHIRNGSVCGPDDLSEKISREEPARQAYFYVNPIHPGKLVNFNYFTW